MKKKFLSIVFLLFAVSQSIKAAPPTLAQNDFYPMHTTHYPFGFLNVNRKEYEKGLTSKSIFERVQMSASVFGQKATRGHNQDKKHDEETTTTASNYKDGVPAGDIYGRWNMLGLLYGNVPTGQTRAALLTTAAALTYHDGQRLDHPNYSDTSDWLGHFTIPLEYRKMGARFQFSTRLFNDVIIQLEGGITDLKQSYSTFTDLGRTKHTYSDDAAAKTGYSSVTGTTTDLTNANVISNHDTIETNLMDNHALIFSQMGLGILDFHETAAEDVFLSLIWRHNHHVNNPDDDFVHDYEYEDDEEWDKFILTPFLKLSGIIGIGKERDNTKAFSITTGNNGHHGISLTFGFSMDFYKSIEMAWEAGVSNFFKRRISGLYVPTDERQTGVFPFKTDVNYEPGKTWHFSFAMNAHHFTDKLSCFAQYLFVNHGKDSISLVTADSAFKPSVLEDVTKWSVQAANIGLNYDLSPHMSVGFTWQAPITRRGAYKTNCVMFSLTGTF